MLRQVVSKKSCYIYTFYILSSIIMFLSVRTLSHMSAHNLLYMFGDSRSNEINAVQKQLQAVHYYRQGLKSK